MTALLLSRLPALYRWLILLALILAVFGFGWVKGSGHEAAARDQLDDKRIAQESTARVTAIARARQTEHTAAAEIHTSTATTQEKTREDQADRARLAGALRLGTARLSVPLLRPACAGMGTPTPAAAGPGNDAAPRADLPPALAADLVELAGEADDTARALTQCQATVTTYLKAINHDQAQ